MYQKERSDRLLGEARRGRARDQIPQLFVGDRRRQFRRADDGRRRTARERSRGRILRQCRLRLRQRPGREAELRRSELAELLADRRFELRRARTPTPTSSCSRAASRRARCAPATRSARSARRPRPATRRRPGRSRPAGRSATARRERRQRADPGSTSTSWAGSTGSAERCVAVTTVWPMPPTRPASTVRRARDRARRERRREAAAAARRGASASRRASASSSARTVRRCSPCEPKPRRSRSPASSRTSCRCGPTPVVARSRSRSSRALELARPSAARLRRRATPPRGRARRRSRGSRARARRASRGGRRRARRRASPPAPSTARSRRATRGRPRHGEAPRSVARPRPRSRSECRARAGCSRASIAVEVRAPRSGTALDDREPVRREDERLDLAAKLLGGGEPRAVQRAALRSATTTA